MSLEKKLPVRTTDDLLWKHLKTIPAFRAILRAVEARFYQQIALPHPILDVGCGDGHFAQVTFDKQLDVGIDPWWGPLQHSQQNDVYKLLLQGMGDEMPFPDGTFASAISNSVLEHIPGVQSVLNETGRVLKLNGRFVITMPCHHFDKFLGGAAWLNRIGAEGLAERYRDFANKISRHVNIDPPEVWAERLAQAGMEVERWQYYFSPGAVRALEIGHVQGVPSAMMRALTGHWIVAPWEESLARTERWLRPYYEEETAVEAGGYIFMVARKVANHPIAAPLPPARPFAIEELMAAEQRRLAMVGDRQSVAGERELVKASQATVAARPSTLGPQPTAPNPQPPASNSNLFVYTLLLGSLFFGIIGQMVLSGSPDVPGRGVIWFVLAGLALFAAGWQQGQFSLFGLGGARLPSIRGWSRQRWLLIPALLLSVLAQGFVGGGGVQRPFLAFATWFAAIGVGYVALRRTPQLDVVEPDAPDGRTVWIGLLLFGGAFSLRVFDLTTHPFMLNGIEASLGLDALNVLRGNLANPFAVGWLTNNTLPTFLMAIPLRLFGPTTFALRLLSPIVGAVTVTAVYLFGKRLWNETVGLLAALLLAGSHFHLHYSRLGMHNIWEPLVTLLALGMVTLAWRGDAETAHNRRLWLLGGGLVGLNAYFFTPSRLLPLMLLLLLLFALLLERSRLKMQWRNVVAAALLGLVVALPQMLYYNNNPDRLMERAQVVGILPEQTGWLDDQAARLGASETAVLRQQLWRGITAFNGGIDRSPSYRADVPLLTFGPGLFFALGLLIGLLRFGSNHFRMLLIWVGVTAVFAGALLLDLPSSHRLLMATPALTLLAAVALDGYGRLFTNALPSEARSKAKRWLQPILLLVVLLFTINDLAFYFGRYQSNNLFGDRNTEVADKMATYLEQQAEPATVYFLGPPIMFSDFPTITYIAQSYQRGVNLFDVEPGETAVPPAPTDKLFFIALPERATELDTFRIQYPGGTVQSFAGQYGNPLFLLYEVEQ